MPSSAARADDKIYIHEDHDFKVDPTTIYYYTTGSAVDVLVDHDFELGTFVFNQHAWSAGVHERGDGECKFSNYTFDRECPYLAVYYYGVKLTPGTTIGPEYRFGSQSNPKDRIFYRTDPKSGNPLKLGKVLDHGAPYDAGFNGVSTGFSIFEFDKISFSEYDCRGILPAKFKVYYLD